MNVLLHVHRSVIDFSPPVGFTVTKSPDPSELTRNGVHISVFEATTKFGTRILSVACA